MIDYLTRTVRHINDDGSFNLLLFLVKYGLLGALTYAFSLGFARLLDYIRVMLG